MCTSDGPLNLKQCGSNNACSDSNVHEIPICFPANSYIIRISKSFLDPQKDFDNATLVNTSSLKPKEAGSEENFEFKPELFRIENGTNFYIAVQAINEANLTSEVSNIAQAIKFIPMPEDSVPALGTKISAISLAIFALAMIFIYSLN